MGHRQHHPVHVDGCFGCKVASISYDRRILSKATDQVTEGVTTVTTPEGTRERTDLMRNTVVEHRDGRQDVTVRPPKVRLSATQREER